MRNIEELREEINIINAQLLELFIKRMEVSKEVALYKKQNGLPVLDRKREEEILQNVVDKTPDELKSFSLEYFKKLMDLSKEYQNEI